MPEYLYQHPLTKKVVSVFQKMTEKHEFFDTNGVEWKRIFTSPNPGIDTRIDPFSVQDFARKTSNKKGNIGDLWDKSKELSQAREKIQGKDQVKEKYYKKWSEKRKGKIHPDLKKQIFNF